MKILASSLLPDTLAAICDCNLRYPMADCRCHRYFTPLGVASIALSSRLTMDRCNLAGSLLIMGSDGAAETVTMMSSNEALLRERSASACMHERANIAGLDGQGRTAGKIKKNIGYSVNSLHFLLDDGQKLTGKILGQGLLQITDREPDRVEWVSGGMGNYVERECP